jgi:Trk K+ transport system NAD-binding subunit
LVFDILRSVETPQPHGPHIPAPRGEVAIAPQSADASRKFVICGDTSLAFRLAEELTSRYYADVTVILSDPEAGRAARIGRLRNVHVIVTSEPDSEAFRRAGLTTADAVAVVSNHDVANVRAALEAQEVCPGVRIVMRLLNTTVREQIGMLFTNAAVMSDSDIAAPAFVSAVLGFEEPVAVRVAGRRLRATNPDGVDGSQVVCALAFTSRELTPILLPDFDEKANLLLVLDESGGEEPNGETAAARNGKRVGLRRIIRNVRHSLSGTQLVSRGLRWTLVVMFAIVILGITAYTLMDRQLSVWQNVYEMLFTSVGAGQTDTKLSAALQIIQLIVTILGVATIPLLSAAIVQASVHARLALGSGVIAAPERDHVVIVGLGITGTRLLRALHERGVEVVAIDHSDNPYGAQFVREHRIPFIQGDSSRESTLLRANVHGAAALVVLTADDVTNLEYGLQGRASRESLRVVLRLFGGEFADRVKRTFNITTSRSVSALAAPTFAAAMVGREVVGTIPVGRRVLLVAELPVLEGSWLAEARLRDVSERGAARVVAVIDAAGTAYWAPEPDRRLRIGETLVVVATGAGLSRIIGQSQTGGFLPGADPMK